MGARGLGSSYDSDGRRRCHDNHDNLGIEASDGGEQFDPVDIGQGDVEEDQIKTIAAQANQGFPTGPQPRRWSAIPDGRAYQ